MAMAMAIEETKAGAASGEQPFGAVVVLNGEVVSRSPHLRVSTSDTTAHFGEPGDQQAMLPALRVSEGAMAWRHG